jgi:hypothetical protein
MKRVMIRDIPIRWDPEDPTRFIVSFEDVDINFDAGIARKLATALLTMAQRADDRIDKTLAGMEGQ